MQRIDWLSRIYNVYGSRYKLVGEIPTNLKSDTKLYFTCADHGVFGKYLYQVHRRKEGCPKCTKLGAPAKKHEEFMKDMRNLYAAGIPFEILGEYKGVHKHILIRDRGVLCKVSPQHLLKGSRGNMTNTLDKTKFMVTQFKDVHGDTYDYSKFEYIGNRYKSTIICKAHGEFKQSCDVHLMGSGCPKCSKLNKNIVGWSRSNYIDCCKNRVATFYIIRCYLGEENFFKIGITINSVECRYASKYEMPYNYEIVHTEQGAQVLCGI